MDGWMEKALQARNSWRTPASLEGGRSIKRRNSITRRQVHCHRLQSLTTGGRQTDKPRVAQRRDTTVARPLSPEVPREPKGTIGDLLFFHPFFLSGVSRPTSFFYQGGWGSAGENPFFGSAPLPPSPHAQAGLPMYATLSTVGTARALTPSTNRPIGALLRDIAPVNIAPQAARATCPLSTNGVPGQQTWRT